MQERSAEKRFLMGNFFPWGWRRSAAGRRWFFFDGGKKPLRRIRKTALLRRNKSHVAAAFALVVKGQSEILPPEEK